MKIASLERIVGVLPHDNANALEVAVIQGYQCVVKKGEFSCGQPVIFIEPDSIISESGRSAPFYQFLEVRGWRIRAMKFRGVFSSGLIVPVEIFKQFGAEEIYVSRSLGGAEINVVFKDKSITFCEGDSVASYVGVEHYQKPEKLIPGDAKGNFPSFLRKTDEPNLRSYSKAIHELLDKEVVITLKIDGQSTSYYLKDDVFGVCSRNLEVKPGSRLYVLADKYKLEDCLRSYKEQFGYNVAIQGECYGEGIQSNPLGIKGVDFYAFNLFNIDSGQYCDYSVFKNFCSQFNIPTVPELFMGKLDMNIEKLVDFASNKKYDNGSWAEGIVIRPTNETKSCELGGRLSVKIISENYKD